MDNFINGLSLIYFKVCYDLGFIAVNGGLFNLSFYLRYVLYYNYYLAKLYSDPKLSWLLAYQVTFLLVVLVQGF